MTPATVAIVVACISALVALTSALGVEGVRRRANRELEQVKHELAEERSARERKGRSADLVQAYQKPVLRAAYDLQSRLYNIHRGFRGQREPDYFVSSTLYVIAEFLGWLEIVRREMQFLDLDGDEATTRFKDRLDRVQGILASTSRRREDHFYVYRGHQRAIGELMIVEFAEPAPSGVRSTVLGYAAFVDRMNEPPFAQWLVRLHTRVSDLTAPDVARLVEVQHALIDIIDDLDPQKIRFRRNRDRVPTAQLG